jgi:lipopolysaccharide/colanic/teichoic acid biosynthesis glycosyltransferase
VSLYEISKRTIDFVSALIALLLALPMMIVLAIIIKVDSPGPVFFRQPRLGKGGRPFQMIKLRSMTQDAAEMHAVVAAGNEMVGPVFKIRSDPRVTRVGRFLRKASLDELPQLWHVLTGEMSLVGPRPPIPEEVARYEPWQRERLAVKPGLTCTWQVSGRSDIPFDRWVQMDIAYIRNRGFLHDLKILLLTVPAVFTGRGAY